jgi:hypothetical protein
MNTLGAQQKKTNIQNVLVSPLDGQFMLVICSV